MKQIQNLIENLELCIPGCDSAPMYAPLPTTLEPGTVLDWLYKNLGEQDLMVYEEWTEYSGYTPELKPLKNITLPIDITDFIFNCVENIDWSESNIEPWELPYFIPWLEHINYYLKPHGVRLVNILPFENAYIICLRDDDTLIQKLHLSLEDLGMGINKREPLDQQQVLLELHSIISG
ncbi:hypothetical protein [Serratia liquefaciens]|uniref:hypothetical protein n=1 Tax=Serratia liquefaciens TaxID=614 RepID=UPI0004AC1A19|nr:hypothetical protein [Serratia liquefaciens]GAK27999.1 hypothetical protein SLIQ_15080 [Serratia liquefaciens FK01]